MVHDTYYAQIRAMTQQEAVTWHRDPDGSNMMLMMGSAMSLPHLGHGRASRVRLDTTRIDAWGRQCDLMDPNIRGVCVRTH